MMEDANTASGMYAKLESSRRPYLDRARECARVTIPSLIKEEGHNDTSEITTPYQSLGSRGVNNLASKTMLSQLPPNTPFFRFQLDDKKLEEEATEAGLKAEVDEELASREQAIQKDVESLGLRPTGAEMFKHLIVGGNALLYLPEDKKSSKVYPLDRYVVERDTSGNVLKIITKDTLSYKALPEDIKPLLDEKDLNKDDEVDIYTVIHLSEGMLHSYQEIKGVQLPDTDGKYKPEASPWLPLRWTKIDGEDYGRSYVEEYLGDLLSLEALSQAIVEFAAQAAKVIWMVSPSGTTNKKKLETANNGDIIHGNAEDVTTLQLSSYADFRVAQETAKVISDRLSYAFLLHSAVQRNGERVTAEEIRFMASELEDALGGIYSLLSQEFQLPLVNVLLSRAPFKTDKNLVNPVIITGLEALGRGHDLQRLKGFLGDVAMTAQLPPEIDKDGLIKRLATSWGIEPKGLIKDPEVLAQEQQQQMIMQMADKAVAPAVNAAGKMAADQQGAQEDG